MTIDELRAEALPHAQALERLATFSAHDWFAPWVTRCLEMSAEFARLEAATLNSMRDEMLIPNE